MNETTKDEDGAEYAADGTFLGYDDEPVLGPREEAIGRGEWQPDMTPEEAEACAANKKRIWRAYRRLATERLLQDRARLARSPRFTVGNGQHVLAAGAFGTDVGDNVLFVHAMEQAEDELRACAKITNGDHLAAAIRKHVEPIAHLVRVNQAVRQFFGAGDEIAQAPIHEIAMRLVIGARASLPVGWRAFSDEGVARS